MDQKKGKKKNEDENEDDTNYEEEKYVNLNMNWACIVWMEFFVFRFSF